MIKNIIWDFDGVILDSMPIREYGFKKIFENFDDALVDKLLEYHTLNGGLSRYIKIKYFYENLLHISISEDKINKLAEDFSFIMKRELINKKYLIEDSLKFIKKNYSKYNFHIASGSDEQELHYLCQKLGIDKYFISINGSPTNKNILVEIILKENNYFQNETILIGDSMNDYEASNINKIKFYGYNNEKLRKISYFYLDNYKELNK